MIELVSSARYGGPRERSHSNRAGRVDDTGILDGGELVRVEVRAGERALHPFGEATPSSKGQIRRKLKSSSDCVDHPAREFSSPQLAGSLARDMSDLR